MNENAKKILKTSINAAVNKKSNAKNGVNWLVAALGAGVEAFVKYKYPGLYELSPAPGAIAGVVFAGWHRSKRFIFDFIEDWRGKDAKG